MSSGKIEQNYYNNVQNSSLFNDYVLHSEDFLDESHNSESKTNKKRSYHFDIIQKIHFILKNSPDLTQKQKYDYCNNQRFFMKQYLKSISEGI
ncbi:MAG: hypothetical protein ACFE9C_10530 [Candidatus Hodarchaeota archaeon]